MPTGGTLRDTYAAAFKRTGRMPDAGVEPPLPDGTAYLLEWFSELHYARGSNGFGMNPISYSELDAWARLTDRALAPIEVQMLKELDLIYLASNVEKKIEAPPNDD